MATSRSGSAALPRLSVMMFLQYFIWGSWYATVSNFIEEVGKAPGAGGWSDELVGWAYTVGPIAAVISPLFLGMVADRFFASQRVLGVMHLLGGALMWTVPAFTGPGDSAVFGWLLLAYMLCYMPTLGLSNTVAFHVITSQERHFPIIRVFGTVGWIAAGFVVSTWLLGDTKVVQFQVCGSASLLLGLYSFTLPHVEPPAKGSEANAVDLLGLRSIGLLREPSFLVFMLASFLICIPLAAYYVWTQVYLKDLGEAQPASVMLYGQCAEVVFILLMPLLFVRLGVRWMLAVGMLAWVVRYGLFAGGAGDGVGWMVLTGILLHGICFDFFFVTGQIYVDKCAPVKLRGQAQSFLVVMTQGLGLGIGAQLMQELKSAYTSKTIDDEKVVAWGVYWIYPAVFAGVILVMFLFLFRDQTRNAADAAA